MSDILDALRRAERERRLGQTPTVESLSYPLSPPVRRRKPGAAWLLAALTGVITVAAVTVLLVQRQAPPAESGTEPAASAPAVTVAAVPPPALPSVQTTPAQEAPAIEDGETLGSLEDLEPTEGESAEPETDPAPPLRSIQLHPEDIAATATPEEPATVVEPPPSAPPAVPLLRDMPPAYRTQFPAITLDVHVHHAEPARRWIMVNGQRYRELEALPSGPRIVEITAEGVVFDYQGAKVLFPVR